MRSYKKWPICDGMIYFDDEERTTKEMEARLHQTHTQTDTYIPGENKRKAKKEKDGSRITREWLKNVYNSGMCAWCEEKS